MVACARGRAGRWLCMCTAEAGHCAISYPNQVKHRLSYPLRLVPSDWCRQRPRFALLKVQGGEVLCE
jgi:hypothetical protein